jgi:hypothetical protein
MYHMGFGKSMGDREIREKHEKLYAGISGLTPSFSFLFELRKL